MRSFAPLLFAALLTACAPLGGRPPEQGGGPPASRGGHEASAGLSIVAELQESLRHAAEALQLTPRQQVLWDNYQEKVGALISDQMKLEPYRPRQTAIPAIERRVDTVRNRLSAMEDILDAANKLYASLDERQKQTADRVLPQTVPALYSGFAGGGGSEQSGGERPQRQGGRGGPGGMGGPGGGSGGPGGGFGRF